MLLAQISDLHIRPQGVQLYDHINTNALCARHVAFLNTLPEKPDAVIITGDITNCGCPQEYEMARQILGQIDYPCYVIPGNHDNKKNFLQGLKNLFPYLGGNPDLMTYTVEDLPIRLVFLDSSVPEQIHGNLSPAALDWLETTLEQEPDKETSVFMHHHPLASGCLHMDNIRCKNGKTLISLLSDYPQVTRVICGHTHRAIFQTANSILISTAPSACHQVPFDTKDINGFYSLEPPAMLMHRYTKETGFVSYVASLFPHDGPFRFDTTLGCPDQNHGQNT